MSVISEIKIIKQSGTMFCVTGNHISIPNEEEVRFRPRYLKSLGLIPPTPPQVSKFPKVYKSAIPALIEKLLDQYYFKVSFTLTEDNLNKLSLKTGLPIQQIQDWFQSQNKMEKLKKHYAKQNSMEDAESLARTRIQLDELEQKVKQLILEAAPKIGHSPEFVAQWLRKRDYYQQKAEKKLFKESPHATKQGVLNAHRNYTFYEFTQEERMITSPSLPQPSTEQTEYSSVRLMKRSYVTRQMEKSRVGALAMPTPPVSQGNECMLSRPRLSLAMAPSQNNNAQNKNNGGGTYWEMYV